MKKKISNDVLYKNDFSYVNRYFKISDMSFTEYALTGPKILIVRYDKFGLIDEDEALDQLPFTI